MFAFHHYEWHYGVFVAIYFASPIFFFLPLSFFRSKSILSLERRVGINSYSSTLVLSLELNHIVIILYEDIKASVY